MRKEDIKIDQLELEATSESMLRLLQKLQTIHNGFTGMRLLTEAVADIYKAGYIKGYHQASGEKVLNQMDDPKE